MGSCCGNSKITEDSDMQNTRELPPLPPQPELIEIGDIVSVGGMTERADLNGARGLVTSDPDPESGRGYMVTVSPYGDFEFTRAQLIYLGKGPNPLSNEAQDIC